MATRRLSILPASQGELAGTTGLATSLTDYIYTPTRIDQELAETFSAG